MVPHLTTCIISLLSLSDYHLVFSFSFWINLFGLFFFFYFVNQSSSCKTFLFIIIISSSLLFSLSLTHFFYCRSTNLKNQCKLIWFLYFWFPDMWWSIDTSDTVDLLLSSPSDHLLGVPLRASPAQLSFIAKVNEQQWPLLVLFHICSLDFWVYTFFPQNFLICKCIPFKLTFHFLIVPTKPTMITRMSPWTYGSFYLAFNFANCKNNAEITFLLYTCTLPYLLYTCTSPIFNVHITLTNVHNFTIC